MYIQVHNISPNIHVITLVSHHSHTSLIAPEYTIHISPLSSSGSPLIISSCIFLVRYIHTPLPYSLNAVRHRLSLAASLGDISSGDFGQKCLCSAGESSNVKKACDGDGLFGVTKG